VRQLRRRIGAFALVFVAAVAAWAAFGSARRSGHVLEIEMRSSAGSIARLFWTDESEFDEKRSSRESLRRTPESFQRLRFTLPATGIDRLRFAPTDAPATILIASARLLDSDGRTLQQLDPLDFVPGNQIASVAPDGFLTRIDTAPQANDPSLFISVPCLAASSGLRRIRMVTPASVAIVGAGSVMLILACAVVILADGFAREPMGASGPRQRASSLLWLLILFAVVFSAKLAVLRAHPLMMPFWDEWDAEARAVLLPLHGCALSWADMFNLHNEHRVFFTRLAGLSLLTVNGQWDPRLQQVFNALMHSVTGVLLAVVLWTCCSRRFLDFFVLLIGLTFAAPFAWENVLMGFQSAFYFQTLFSVLAIWLVIRYEPPRPAWWLGVVCAVCAIFSAAGGLLAAVDAAAIVGLRAIARSGSQSRRWLITVTVMVAIALLGILVSSPPLPHHAGLKSDSLADFVGAAGHALAWPWIGFPAASVLVWLPLGVLLATSVGMRQVTLSVEWAAALGLWVLLQAVAVAYGRGHGAPIPATRYQDFLSLGFVANAFAGCLLFGRMRAGTWSRVLVLTTFSAWMLVAAFGIERRAASALTDLESWRTQWAVQASHLRQFVISGDYTALTSAPAEDLPYPDAGSLARVVHAPYIRSILPASIREPVHVLPAFTNDDTFVRDGAFPTTPASSQLRAWGSYSSRGSLAMGEFGSRAMTPCERLPYLRFQLAGYLGLPGLTLSVRDIQSGREFGVRPWRLAHENWMDVAVRCPSGPYEIRAVDQRPDYWFAFREPAEIGRSSLFAETLIAASFEMFCAALAFLFVVSRWTSRS
jgi:hypothetical protein